MPIPFTCPHCGATTDVAEAYVGQSGPCAACGKTVTVPPPASSGGGGGGKGGATVALAVVAVVVLGSCCLLGVVGIGGSMFYVRSAAPMQVAPQAVYTSATVAAPPPVQGPAEFACHENLRKIGIALMSYRDAYGAFPPPYVAGDDGAPRLSWRVLILPYLGRQDLYEQVRFDEAWDGPTNGALASQMPPVFGCAASTAQQPVGSTAYQVVVGPETIFSPDGPVRIEEISDGIARTILVVESSDLVPWMAPQDLEFARLAPAINDPAGHAIGSGHPGGAHALTAEGAIRFLPDSTTPEVTRALLTRAGFEVIEPPTPVAY
jgi:hypothetical protein